MSGKEREEREGERERERGERERIPKNEQKPQREACQNYKDTFNFEFVG